MMLNVNLNCSNNNRRSYCILYNIINYLIFAFNWGFRCIYYCLIVISIHMSLNRLPAPKGPNPVLFLGWHPAATNSTYSDLINFRPTGGSNVLGAGRYKPDQLTEAVSTNSSKVHFSDSSYHDQNNFTAICNHIWPGFKCCATAMLN